MGFGICDFNDMSKVVTIEQASEISKKLQNQGKTVVVAGGCFDILHIGHVNFLTEAKKQGDALFVLLESDANIKKQKGQDRPIYTQKDRAAMLAALSMVDYVVLLPEMIRDKDYDDVLISLKPAIIATTIGDPNRSHKERQAALVNGKVVDVIDRITHTSTSRLAALLSKEL